MTGGNSLNFKELVASAKIDTVDKRATGKQSLQTGDFFQFAGFDIASTDIAMKFDFDAQVFFALAQKMQATKGSAARKTR